MREIDVLKLLAAGASNREIADQLVLAEGTVKEPCLEHSGQTARREPHIGRQ